MDIKKQQAKDKLVRAIKNFETSAAVECDGGEKILKEAVAEHPELLFYVNNLTYRPFGYGCEFTFGYRNKDIPIGEIKVADDGDDVFEFMHEAIRKFRRKCYIVAPAKLKTGNIFSEFVTIYGGYYSNLVHYDYTYFSFDFFGPVECYTFEFTFRLGSVKLNMMESGVAREIARLKTDLFAPGMTDEVKAYAAHNYLARTVTYWKKEEPNALERSYMQSAYGALVNKKCVCQGYAEAFKRLMDSQGIQCDVICGKIRHSEENHAWNIIKLGGEYFHVDVTWDSIGDGRKRDDYFCLGDKALSAERIWTKRRGVVCTSSRSVRNEVKSSIAFNKSIVKPTNKSYLD